MLGTLIGLVVGAVISIAVSRYYFVQTFKTRLAIYVFLVSHVFSGIDDEVQRALSIRFRGTPVKDLTHLEYLIANQGKHTIKDCIDPLSIVIPKAAALLDASILYSYPEGREVRLEKKQSEDGQFKVQLLFDILNPGDFFLIKLLLDGPLSEGQLKFSITAEGLPPVLQLERDFPDFSGDRPRFSWIGVLVGILAAMIGVFLLAPLWILHSTRPDLFPIPWNSFQPSFALIGIIAIALLGLLFIFIAGAMLLGSAFGGSFPPQPTFPLPSHLRLRGQRYFYGVGRPLQHTSERRHISSIGDD